MSINTTQFILSEGLVEIINECLKEVVIKGVPFEQRRKWLTRYFGMEGADYPIFEASMLELISALNQEKPDKKNVRSLAESCFVSVQTIDDIFEVQETRKVATIKDELESVKKKAEQERLAAERAEKEIEEKEREMQQERKRVEKLIHEKTEAEKKAKEKAEAERKAKEEAARKAREKNAIAELNICIDKRQGEAQHSKTIEYNGLVFSTNMEKLTSVKHIVICHTGVSSAHTIKEIHAWRLKAGDAGIGYHFFVDKKGKVFRGRPLTYMGAFAREVNRCSIGVCFDGNFNKEKLNLQQQLSMEAIELLTLLRYVYHADIVFYDEFGDKVPIKGFPKRDILNRIDLCYNNLLSEQMRVFGGMESERFYEHMESRMDEYGIPQGERHK